jgi:four helix bundle protein
MMTYDEWLKSVPPELTEDPLWRMEVFRYALFIGDLSWHDVSKLVEDKRALRLSSQLYSTVGSIAANIAEGYSHRSRKDQARFCEYALGSVREARVWYYQSKNILPETVTEHSI